MSRNRQLASRARSAAPLGMLAAGLFALCTAWACSNPIGAAPDEPAHYIRALGVAEGDWVGVPESPQHIIDTLPAQARPTIARAFFALLNTRAVRIPARLRPGAAGCTLHRRQPAATCLVRNVSPPSLALGQYLGPDSRAYTYLADRAPLVYWPVGVVMQTRTTTLQAFIAGRLVNAAIAVLLLVCGLWLLASTASQPARALAGALVAITPMVVFSSSIVDTSAVEIAAGIATSCATLAVVYGRDLVQQQKTTIRRAPIVLLAVAASCLAVSRPLGPAWVVLILGTGAILLRRSGIAALLRAHRRALLSAGALIAVCCAAGVAWEIAFQPAAPSSLSLRMRDLFEATINLPETLREEVGVFGWLDTAQLRPAYYVWGAMSLALVVLALRRASWRERSVLVGWMALSLVLIPVLNAVLADPDLGAITVQGRHLLPVVTIVPLLSAFILGRNARADPAERAFTLAAFPLFALLQFLALYANAAHAGATPGASPLFFLSGAAWSPPLGWLPWMLLAASGAAACVAAGALAGNAAPPPVYSRRCLSAS